MKTPRLTTAGVLLTSVILAQACSTAKPSPNSQPESDTSRAETSAAVPPRATGQQCDPNYSECVPIASDVDCAGGKGNGPAYVKGPVRVVGKDIYKLDGDHNGIGCE